MLELHLSSLFPGLQKHSNAYQTGSPACDDCTLPAFSTGLAVQTCDMAQAHALRDILYTPLAV